MNRYYITAEEVERIKSITIGVTCKGMCKGGSIFDGRSFSDCICKKDFQTMLTLVSAGVPKKYWDFSFKSLLKKFIEENEQPLLIVKSYMNKLPEMIEEGFGLYIVGASGLAKTALGIDILKEAMKLNYICYFTRMSQLTKMCIEQFRSIEQRNRLKWIREMVDLLLIDEIEKDFHIQDPNTFVGTHVNEYVNELYGSKKSLIITSNLSKKALKGIHSDGVIDRLEELVDVVLTGKSYRGQNQIRDKILGVSSKVNK